MEPRTRTAFHPAASAVPRTGGTVYNLPHDRPRFAARRRRPD